MSTPSAENPPDLVPPVVPSIKRRLATLPYEGLIVLAVVVIATFPVAGMKGATLSGAPHFMFQAYLFVVTATYFVWFWRHGGQTLAMKTWRIRVVSVDGSPLSLPAALARFVCVLLFYGPACVGLVLLFFPERISRATAIWAFFPMMATILWARFDADRQFLHDRIARTRLVNVKPG